MTFGQFINRELTALKEKMLLVPMLKVFLALLAGLGIALLFPAVPLFALCAIPIAVAASLIFKKRLPYTLLILLGASLPYLEKGPESLLHNRFEEYQFVVVEKAGKEGHIISIGNEKVLLINGSDFKEDDEVKAVIMIESLRSSSLPHAKEYTDRGIDLYARIHSESDPKITGSGKVDAGIFYSAKRFFYNIQQELLDRASMLNIAKVDEAVVKAIALGQQRGITMETRDRYSQCGVSHIIAISGLHIGIIFLILNAIAYPLPNSRAWRTVKLSLIILVMWFYVFTAGAAPSALRSALMLTLLQFCISYRRSRYRTYNVLFGSAAFFTLVDYHVLADIGFQLSYLSVFAILFIYSKISLVITTKYSFLNRVLSAIFITISVQLITAPLVSYYFGVVPIIGVTANLVFTTLLPFLLGFSLLFIAIPNEPCQEIIRAIMDVLNGTLDKLTAVPYSYIDNFYITGWSIALYFVLFALIALYFSYFFKIVRK